MSHTHRIRLATFIGALALTSIAHAGPGTKPSSISLTAASVQKGIAEAHLFEAGGAIVAMLVLDANAPGNAEGITLIRGGNHKIARPAVGKQLDLVRMVGEADGSVLLTYASPTVQFGLRPIVRKINPDNTLGFEKVFQIERAAGLAGDAAGGAYLAAHVPYALPGQVVMKKTHHRTYRLTSTGEVAWQVESAGADKPFGSSQHASTATRSSDGVFVGYGVGDGIDESFVLTPVLEHRAASDGALIYSRVGLKKPAAVAPGAVGNVAMNGLVSRVVVAADGSAIAIVDNQQVNGFVVHVDASGTQTAAYGCAGGLSPFAKDEVACVDLSPKLSVTRWGVVSGKLVVRAKWAIDPPAGVTQTTWAATAGKQMLVAGYKSGDATVSLYSTTGVRLATLGTEVEGKPNELYALQGSWIGYGTETLPDSARFAGTYVVGGTSAGVSAPSSALPTRPY